MPRRAKRGRLSEARPFPLGRGGFLNLTINEIRLVQQARTLCAGDAGSEPRQAIAQTKVSDPSRANHSDERRREDRVDCYCQELVT
jgi:hypothetical protein